MKARMVDLPANWKPLENRVGEENCHFYMYMYGALSDDGILLHAYKHVDTREYLFLDEDGQEWEYSSGVEGLTQEYTAV